MMELKEVGDYVTKEEQGLLTLWQQVVLAALRKYGSAKQASSQLHRDQVAIRMMMMRIRKRGVRL